MSYTGLGQDGELVIYGCMTGQAPVWNWQSWVFKNIKVVQTGPVFPQWWLLPPIGVWIQSAKVDVISEQESIDPNDRSSDQIDPWQKTGR